MQIHVSLDQKPLFATTLLTIPSVWKAVTLEESVVRNVACKM